MLTTEERKQICKELKLQAKGIIPAPIGVLNFYIPSNQTLDFFR